MKAQLSLKVILKKNHIFENCIFDVKYMFFFNLLFFEKLLILILIPINQTRFGWSSDEIVLDGTCLIRGVNIGVWQRSLLHWLMITWTTSSHVTWLHFKDYFSLKMVDSLTVEKALGGFWTVWTLIQLVFTWLFITWLVLNWAIFLKHWKWCLFGVLSNNNVFSF